MVVEEAQEKRLKEFGINIKTKFKDGDKVLERNTDHSKEDNIKSGIILEKDYYKNGILMKKENLFDSRMIYSYVFNQEDTFCCKNCGMTSTINDFQSGCPYCHTSYNMEYLRKELGSKHYYDLTVKSKKYIYVTYIIDFIVSFLITLTFIIDTSRTFYIFDMLKVLAGTILISLLLFYVFYYLDAVIILPGVKKWKENMNRKQEEFWESINYTDEDRTRFFNNFQYSLRQLYYSDREKNVVDFDIIDYNSFRKDSVKDQLYVDVSVDIRIVSFHNGKIQSKKEQKTYRFHRVEHSKELQGGANLITCPNCSSSIDVKEEKCSYCGTEINHYQEWYLDKVID